MQPQLARQRVGSGYRAPDVQNSALSVDCLQKVRSSLDLSHLLDQHAQRVRMNRAMTVCSSA